MNTEELQDLLINIEQKARQQISLGKVADYIPALSEVCPDQFGIAVCDLNGNIVQAGDATTPFSIQSISKLFTLVQALQIYGESLWERIGREPSGHRFNSLIQLETERGIPRNPFINAGALAICDRVESRSSAPNFQLLTFLRELSLNEKIHFNTKVARSELDHSARNAAMAYLMKAYGNFDNPVDKVIESYTHHCAIEMSCVDLARASLFLANHGLSLNEKTVLKPKQTKRVNALLATCGLYDAAGDFAYRVGLPGKSGVGGGIVAIYPGHYSICVWSPALNQVGNSVAGIYALERLSDSLNASIF